MNTFFDVKARVRNILGDQEGQWLTDGYLDGMTNHCYDLIVLDMSETCSPYITKVVTIPNLPFGTTDLSPYQNVNGGKNNTPKGNTGQLYGLMDVFRNGVDWKVAGQAECYYTPVTQKDKLPNYTLTGPSPVSTMYFEWRAYVLYVTPLPMNIDLRVRGEFRPAPLVKDDDVVAIHPMMASALAEQVAACAMRERANPGQMQTFSLVGSEALDNIKNQLVRAQQGNTVRLGRLSRRGGSRGSCGIGYGS